MSKTGKNHEAELVEIIPNSSSVLGDTVVYAYRGMRYYVFYSELYELFLFGVSAPKHEDTNVPNYIERGWVDVAYGASTTIDGVHDQSQKLIDLLVGSSDSTKPVEAN